MPPLIQKLHPPLRAGQQLLLGGTHQPFFFSRQDDWDGGNARLEAGEPYALYITPEATVQADIDGAVSIRTPEEKTTGACCA